MSNPTGDALAAIGIEPSTLKGVVLPLTKETTMADTKATYHDQKQGKNAPNDAARDIPKRTEPERMQPKREPTDEQIDQSLKAIRELVQNLRNRGDQDVNKVLDNMSQHLEVIDPQEEAA